MFSGLLKSFLLCSVVPEAARIIPMLVHGVGGVGLVAVRVVPEAARFVPKATRMSL